MVTETQNLGAYQHKVLFLASARNSPCVGQELKSKINLYLKTQAKGNFTIKNVPDPCNRRKNNNKKALVLLLLATK